MKFLTPILVLFVGMSAMAQYNNAELDPARRAELRARDGGYGPGYLTPGNIARPPAPGRPYPPMPPPRPAPGYGDYGPQITVRWQDSGANRLPKIITESFTVHVGNVLTNEVLVRALDSRVEIQSALAYLTDGRVVPLTALHGTINKNRELRSLLDYHYSLRVNRIEFRATSDKLFGSRAKIQVLVGLAQ